MARFLVLWYLFPFSLETGVRNSCLRICCARQKVRICHCLRLAAAVCTLLLPVCFSASACAASAADALLEKALHTAPAASQWPDQGYVKLLDVGDVTVKPNGVQVAVYQEAFKLFHRSARSLGEVNLAYNAAYQTIRLISAETVEPNGHVLRVLPSQVRNGGVVGEYAMYSDAQALMFSMPGLRNNCVISYRYEVITHSVMGRGLYWLYWGFNDSIPVELSRFTLHVPAGQTPAWKLHHATGIHVQQSMSKDGTQRVFTWQKKHMPPIPVEPAMPPVRKIRTWLEVSSVPSWSAIAAWFHGLQAPQMQPDSALLSLEKRLTKGLKTPAQKAAALYGWVAGQVRYVGLEFGISAYKPHPAAEVCRNLYGDCKDKANLLITLLKMAGIEAWPALLKANSTVPVSDELPTLSAFDHAIVLADAGGTLVWLDPTAETEPYGSIPAADKGAQALVVKGAAGEFMQVPPYTAAENGSDMVLNLHILPTGAVRGSAALTLRGAMKETMRASLARVPAGKRQDALRSLAQRLGLPGETDEVRYLQNPAPGAPVVLLFRFHAGSLGREIGSMQLLPLFTAMSGPSQQNPYLQKKRVWPIWSGTASHLTTRTRIELPAGWSIEALPKPVMLSDPLQTYQRTVQSLDNGHAIEVTDRYVQLTGMTEASGYAQVQSFWTALLKTAGDAALVKRS